MIGVTWSTPSSTLTVSQLGVGKTTVTVVAPLCKPREFFALKENEGVPAPVAVAVKPPFASATTVIPAGVTVVRSTVSGNFAPSVHPASTPGVLIAMAVAMVEVNVEGVQVMPVSLARTDDAPSVTVAEMPEEQTPAVTVPFAQ